jgi:hypothetical protein
VKNFYLIFHYHASLDETRKRLDSMNSKQGDLTRVVYWFSGEGNALARERAKLLETTPTRVVTSYGNDTEWELDQIPGHSTRSKLNVYSPLEFIQWWHDSHSGRIPAIEVHGSPMDIEAVLHVIEGMNLGHSDEWIVDSVANGLEFRCTLGQVAEIRSWSRPRN